MGKLTTVMWQSTVRQSPAVQCYLVFTGFKALCHPRLMHQAFPSVPLTFAKVLELHVSQPDVKGRCDFGQVKAQSNSDILV